jgi:spore maturation protein SpmA
LIDIAKSTMTLAQPATFTLTDQEAAAVQSAQLAQQAKVAGSNPMLKIASVAVPIILVVVIVAIDRLWYGGAMPASLFVTMLVLFVAGMATAVVVYRLSLRASKRLLREKTRQVSWPRTVRLTDEGIEQALPDLRSVHLWSGIDRVEQSAGLILAWAGNVLVSAIPERAFASPQDAQAFAEACRTRADGTRR